MHALAQQHCLNHLDREAVARCPECTQYFCRECVVEHDDRLLCAACLRRLLAAAGGEKRFRFLSFAPFARALQLTLGVLAAWLFFYFAGRALLLIPSSFHDGTVWHSEDAEP